MDAPAQEQLEGKPILSWKTKPHIGESEFSLQGLLTHICRCYHRRFKIQCFKQLSESSQIHMNSAITIPKARAMLHSTEIPSKPG